MSEKADNSQSAKPIPKRLTILVAERDGYVVVDDSHTLIGGIFSILFAGTLSHCLSYIESAFQPPMAIMPDTISPEVLKAALKPGPVTFVLHGGSGGSAIGSGGLGASAEQRMQERRELLDRNQTVTGDPVDLRGLDPARNDYWDRRPGRSGDAAEPMTLDDVLDIYRLEDRRCGVEVISQTWAMAWIGDPRTGLLTGDPQRRLTYTATGPDCLEALTKWLLEQRR